MGVFRALRPKSVLDIPSEIDGMALEGLVAQHLRAWVAYTRGKHSLHFWRTKVGLEVDFVVYGELGFWAIEVKHSAHLHPGDFRGLTHFKSDYPEAKTLMLYRGAETMLQKDTLCVPCETFLKQLRPDAVLWA